MVDIFSIQKGDIIVYGKYAEGSVSNPVGPLTSNRYFGVYQDLTFWSPDGTPVKSWICIVGQDGMHKVIHPSQVTNVIRGATC